MAKPAKKTAAPKAAPKIEPVVVEASMAAGAGSALGVGLTGKAIEDAMSAATMAALEKGIVDPDKILALKLAAREKVKKDHAAAVKAAAKSASD